MSLDDLDFDSLAEKIAVKLAEQLRTDERRLLDRSELAERLGISERGVSSLAQRGELPAGFLIGGIRRWDWSDVLRFVRDRSGRKPRNGRGRYHRNP